MSFNTPPNQKKIIGFGMILSLPKRNLVAKMGQQQKSMRQTE